MKFKIISLLIILTVPVTTFAQDFLVSKVLGNVSDGGKIVKAGDNIQGIDQLKATTAGAAIRVVSPKTGSIVISFAHGKKMLKNDQPDHSELYELVVQDYVDKYTASGSTQTKTGPQPKFDWVGFFYAYPDGQADRKMLIVEGEQLQLESAVFNPATPYDVYAATYTTKADSVLHQLSKQNNAISFLPAYFPPGGAFNLDVYISYNDKQGNLVYAKVTKQSIHATYLTLDELNATIHLFYDDWEKNYKSEDHAKQDCYAYLKYNYDRFYEPLISAKIDAIFK